MQSIDEIRKKELAAIGERRRMLEARIEELLGKEGNYLNSRDGYIHYPYLDLYNIAIVPQDFELLKEIFDAKGYTIESGRNLGGALNLTSYRLSIKAKE
jgi:hypothetical protein